MKNNSKPFFFFMFLFIIVSILYSYYVFMIKNEYKIFYSEDSIPNQTDIISIIKL